MNRQRGFTFVELVISTVVIAIAVTGVLLVFTETVARSADPLIRVQALAIAESYLDEIVSKHHDDPDGADGEASRDLYDDVDDYDGLSGAPSRPDGSTAGLTGLADYLVAVTVTNTTLNGVAALRVDVTVTHTPTNIDISLWGYRTDYGP